MGNRLQKIDSGTGTENYTYDNANVLLTRGTNTYTNDANGKCADGRRKDKYLVREHEQLCVWGGWAAASFRHGTPQLLAGSAGDRLLFSLSDMGTEEEQSQGIEVCRYLNGVQVTQLPGTEEDSLDQWNPVWLKFGSDLVWKAHWHGVIHEVAIFSRFVDAARAQQEYAAYSASLQSRKGAPQLEMDASLAAVSKLPTLRDIAPYRTAVVVSEYNVG